MKKLMMATAVALTAICSQAAVIKWNCSNIYNEAGATTIPTDGGYSAYLFTTAVLGVDKWSNLDAAGLAANLAKGQATDITGAGAIKNLTGVQHDDTSISKLGLTPGTAAQMYAVIVNSDSSKYYVSTVSAAQTPSQTASESVTFGVGSQKSYTWKDDSTKSTYVGWSTVSAVPEPTSGLLLLLGVAGLALRRRRA